jgi:hypothetical protein
MLVMNILHVMDSLQINRVHKTYFHEARRGNCLKFKRHNDGDFYAATLDSDTKKYRIGISYEDIENPYWTYDTLFDSLEQANKVCEMMQDAYNDGIGLDD